MRQIVVIDPAVRVPELDCFNQLSLSSGIPTSYHLPALYGQASLEAVRGSPAGIVILGSSSSVHDNLAWQQALGAWLSPLIKQGVPTLGLCFGHQLIAHLFDGEVDFCTPEKTKFQGFRSITFHSTRLWRSPSRGEVFVSHREAVVKAPEGFRIIATSAEVPIEGLEHEQWPVWTLQSHPEATSLFLKNVGTSAQVDSHRFAFGHSLVRKFLEWAAKPV